MRSIIVALFLAAGSPAGAQPSETVEKPSSPAAKPGNATASATVTIRILTPVTMKDGKSSEPHTRSKTKIQDADGNWREIEVLDFP